MGQLLYKVLGRLPTYYLTSQHSEIHFNLQLLTPEPFRKKPQKSS